MKTGAGKNDAANSRRDASDDIQRAIDHTRSLSVMIAISELKAAPKPPQSLLPCQVHAQALLMERW